MPNHVVAPVKPSRVYSSYLIKLQNPMKHSTIKINNPGYIILLPSTAQSHLTSLDRFSGYQHPKQPDMLQHK